MNPTDTARAKNLALARAMAQFVVVLDASIVNVALPSIGRDLDFAQEDLSWVINSYTLFFGGFLLLGEGAPGRPEKTAHVHLGHVAVRLRLTGRRARPERHLADRGARRRAWGSAHLPGRSGARDHHLAEGAERNKALGVWARWPARRPPACCWAASSPRRSAGSGCCS